MKKLAKRAVCLGLTAGMSAMSLAGCGQKKDTSVEVTDTAALVEESELTSSGASARFYNEDGTMKLPIDLGEDYTFRVLWRKAVNDKGTLQDKYMLQKALEATGLKFEIEEIAENAWDDKISVIFASGDLPDLIMGEIASTSFTNYLDQCADLTDLLPVYAPYVYDFFYNQYPEMLGTNVFDGRVRSLNGNRMNGAYSRTLWSINKRWLENVGMDIPTTTDEFYEVLKAFKEQDANGNGDPNDEIPYEFYDILTPGGLLSMAASFGLVNDGVSAEEQYIMVEDGAVKFMPTEERFYEMLVYLNKLYKEGLLDPDGLIQEQTDRNLKGNADRIGFLTHNGLVTSAVGDTLGNDFVYIIPPASEHGAVIKQRPGGAETSKPDFIITTKCKYPEALLVFANYINSTHENRFAARFGPEGTGWILDENGKAANASDFTGKPYSNREEATRTCGLDKVFCTLITEEDEAFRSAVGFTIPYNDAMKMYGPDGGHAWEEGFPIGNDTLENANTRSEIFAELDTYVQNFVAESMTSGIDEGKWKTFLENCQKLNVDEYVQCYQALYDKIKAEQ